MQGVVAASSGGVAMIDLSEDAIPSEGQEGVTGVTVAVEDDQQVRFPVRWCWGADRGASRVSTCQGHEPASEGRSETDIEEEPPLSHEEEVESGILVSDTPTKTPPARRGVRTYVMSS
jgi:hypothetical protein